MFNQELTNEQCFYKEKRVTLISLLAVVILTVSGFYEYGKWDWALGLIIIAFLIVVFITYPFAMILIDRRRSKSILPTWRLYRKVYGKE